ncbi:uncharacterized protein PV06_05665 [Exophiala oligosperma]|uniref:Uncharacterized protein n=2 Tax=Chaetothyriales TaxID=34395 RepID=A0A0D2AQ76_9EURO|nr:uncharacterized protein PV06_05665 [Exophiala oligosperma]KAJ9633824.1 hypothetical protein H2204_006609 [Knufia peltigerae]KIW42081.1 hypothetical protein PV06_05665 [Exophiala oligosperma]
MDSAPPTGATGGPQTADELPPEAIALASRFFEAARHGQMDIFEQALPQGLPANLTNDKGDSLLMLASYHGHEPLASLLVQHGADPNRLNDRGQSILAGVVFKNEAEIIKLLLKAGADPELGEPSALEATRVFRQEDYEGMFREQIQKLKEARTAAVNGH